MKPLHYFILFVGIILIQTSVHAQFKYIGVDGQVYAAGGNTFFTTSLNYLKQVSSHHGIGVELGIPIAYGDAARKVVIDTLGYDAGVIWRRQYLPHLGLRYRFFASNSFFVGVLANVGLMRERFFADRHFQYADTYDQEAIPPVYYDYVIRSPFFRVTVESGFVLDLGKLLYGTLHGRLGVQYTKPPIEEFGRFQISADDPTPFKFAPYQGVGLTGGFSFGLGVKL